MYTGSKELTRGKYIGVRRDMMHVYREFNGLHYQYDVTPVYTDDDRDKLLTTEFDLTLDNLIIIDTSYIDDISIANDDKANLFLRKMFSLDVQLYTLPSNYQYKDNTCLYIKCTDNKDRVAITQTDNAIDVLKLYVGMLDVPKYLFIVKTSKVYKSKIFKN